jgi:hypothetical protein
MIAGGSLLSCFGILGMVMIAFMSIGGIGGVGVGGGGGASRAAVARTISAMLPALGLYGALIWIGIGCCMGRRWVRPLVIIGSVIAIATGIVSIVPMTWAAARTFSHAMSASPTTSTTFAAGTAPAPPPIAVAIGGIIGAVIGIGLLIVVPAFMFQFFRKDTVRQSLETTDPKTRWTDGIPLPLLGWAVGSVVFGLSDFATGFNGFYPLFTSIITGPIAAVAMGIIGTVLIVGGFLSYHRSSLGWLLSITAAAFMGASLLTFSLFGDSQQYQQLLLSGFGPTVRQNAASSISTISPTLVPAIMSVLAVGYGIWLRPRVAVKAR